MSRRLSKKSRSKALAGTTALSAANLPKPESQRLDHLFARAIARQKNLRASLLVGSALTAGFLVASLVSSSPAFAGCTQTGDTVTCTAGNYPAGIGPYFNEGGTPEPSPFGVETINGTGVIITGPNGNEDGVTLSSYAFAKGTPQPSPALISLDSASSIAGVSRDGIHMFSNYTDTVMSIVNAAPISAPHDAIYAHIKDFDETSNDSIYISNSGALAGGGHDGISAYILGNTSSTFRGADNTITIINAGSGTIGNSTSYTGGDGIFAEIKKYGGAGTPGNIDPKATASVSNSKNIFSTFSSIHEIEIVTDVIGGIAGAYSYVSNSGNLTSKDRSGIHAYAHATTSGGSATAGVSVLNAGTIVAKGLTSTDAYGIRGYAHADTGYVTGNTTKSTSGGNSSATVAISNAGNITTGNATHNAQDGIYGHAFAQSYGTNDTVAKGYSGSGGSATAAVTITNGNATVAPAITTNGTDWDINGNATANADGRGYSGHGGNASATTTLSNFGPLTIVGNSTTNNDMLQGYAGAHANGYGGNGSGGNASASTGGSANAGVTISNVGNLTSTVAPGIYGEAIGEAFATDDTGSAFTATGGHANALSSITNSNAISSHGTSIQGTAKGNASAYANTGNGTATGGTASSTVSISNSNSLKSSSEYGIHGYAFSNSDATGYNATGGTASATVSISNGGALTVHNGGISATALEYAEAFGNLTAKGGAGTGGVAPATVSVINSMSITSSNAYGIGGYAKAGAGAIGFVAKGGTATATTSISNSGALYTHHTGIYGAATALSDTWGGTGKGGSASGGTSTATVSITNTGNIYAGDGLSHQHIYGIYGNSFASASGGVIVIPIFGTGPNSLFPIFNPGGGAYTAKGGTATATTTISNTGNMTVKGHHTEGIYGGATAFAYANGNFSKGGSATGGTAIATTTVTNANDTIYNARGSSIKAVSYANAKAHGYVAKGGTATASTTVSNSGYLLSYHYTAIHAESYADADGRGNSTGTLPGPGAKGSGTGGTASATVLITNIGTVQAGAGHGDYAYGIVGSSGARAVGAGYTAKGGVATALTSITNGGNISSFDGTGIYGYAGADANAFGNKTDGKGVAHAGTASASVLITNTGNILFGGDPYGITGYSHAKAVGAGFHAYGGTATAVTTIYNTGTLTADSDTCCGGAGINGYAKANAGAYGGSKVEPGKAVGGTATATTTISNYQAATITSYGDGIDGGSRAKAEAYGRQAKGGTATALTLIHNAANIYANGDGIFGNATAAASGHGDYSISGYGKGGTATATLSILNTGNISAGEDGIFGFSGAFANGHGTAGTGGTANATTIISNTGVILSYFAGIVGLSLSEADGFGTGGKGGTATATTTILNGSGANIKTYGEYAPGIYASSGAFADYPSPGSVGGTATATTSVSNGGSILTLLRGSPGIAAYSYAGAFAQKGGTATATTTVTNSNTITTVGGNWTRPCSDGIAIPTSTSDFGFSGNASSAHNPFWVLNLKGSPGIIAGSAADSAGSARATTLVNNSGDIATEGPVSPGIFAWSIAAVDATSSAYASTTVNNTGNITTLSWGSDGIVARSAAYGYGFTTNAVAKTTVSNGGAITTFGGGSAGIYAYSFAATDPSATTLVTNTGNITTYGHHAPGIEAGAVSFAGLGGPSTATTDVYNGANIKTTGHRSDGIIAFTYAASASSSATATTLVSNGGTVVTTGRHSVGVYAYAGVNSVSPTLSKATITIDNGNATVGGLIATTGSHSDAIYALVNAPTASTHNSITVNNSALSTITATAGWHQFGYHAIVAYGAPVTINNNGEIDGNVLLSNFGDTFNNNATGTWLMKGNSYFNGGTDVVNNAGLVKMDANAAAHRHSPDPATYGEAIRVITLYGLEVFNNDGGTLSMANGSANDRIVITGPSSLPGGKVYFNGSGNSTLVIDAVLAGPPVTVTHKYHYTTTITTGSSSTYTVGNFSVHGGSVSFSGPIGDGNFTVGFGGFSGNFTGNSTTTVYGNSTTKSGTGTKTYTTYTSTADVLQIGGKGSKGYAVGVTAIVVHDVGSSLAGAYNPFGIPVVESNGAANIVITPHTVAGVTIGGPANVAGNFFLENGPIQKGFFEYGLFYLPKGDNTPCQSGFNCWFLASTPGTAAQEFTQLGQAADDIWSDAAGLWLDRTADLRDYFFNAQSTCDARGGGADLAVKAPPCVPTPSGVGPGAWVRAYGDWIHSNEDATWNAWGTTITTPVHYNQNIAGAQIGYDWAFMRTGYSTVLVGLLGGANESTVNFASGTKVNFQGGNAGAYATFLNRGFFADGLFLANWMSMDYTSAGSLFGLGGSSVANVAANSDMSQYGGRIDSGYRFQFNPWFIEPQLTAEVVHTSFGNLPFPIVGTNVQLDDDFSVRGRLGGRIGTTWVTSGWRIEPSIDGGVWETFAGNNGAVLTNNGFALDLTDPNNNKTLGEIGGMLNFYQIGTNWSAFVKGDYRFADQYTSGSVKGGMRYQWP